MKGWGEGRRGMHEAGKPAILSGHLPYPWEQEENKGLGWGWNAWMCEGIAQWFERQGGRESPKDIVNVILLPKKTNLIICEPVCRF